MKSELDSSVGIIFRLCSLRYEMYRREDQRIFSCRHFALSDLFEKRLAAIGAAITDPV